MQNSVYNKRIYFVITTEKDKKNAYKIAELILEDKLTQLKYCIHFNRPP